MFKEDNLNLDLINLSLNIDLIRNTPLLEAVQYGDLAKVKRLLTQPDVSLKETNLNGQTPLLVAAAYGQLEIIKLLLTQSSVSLKETGATGQNALSTAIMHGHLETVKWMLNEPGISLKETNLNGQTPLLVAAAYGQLEIIKLLLTQPSVSLKEIGATGQNALSTAIMHGHLETVKWMLNEPGISLKETNLNGQTPLLVAAAYGQLEIIKHLLTQPRVSLKETGTTGHNALLTAIMYGQLETVKWILTQPRVSLKGTNQYGQPPLLVAAAFGQLEIIKHLLTQPDVIDSLLKILEPPTEQQMLDSMLFKACQENNLIKISRLLKLGSNIEAKNSLGLTSLFYSLLRDQMNVASLLLNKKANVEALNPEGQTILHVVCKQGDLQKVKFILPYISKSDTEASVLLSAYEMANTPKIKQIIADTILFQAIKQGNQNLAELILEKGANKEARQDSFTPLHNACYHNQIEIVRLLLSRGCSTFSKDQYDRVPVESTSKQEIRDLISKHQDDKATLIQKRFRGHRIRKKIFPEMQKNYKNELQQKSGETLAKFSANGEFDQILAFGTAMKENHLHQAAQIIGLRAKEIHTRTRGQMKY